MADKKSPADPLRRRRSADPRQKRDPERTRRLLLAAAAEEFGRHGYDAARVARIADAAGVGHQLITYHFGGKKGLYDALEERWLDHNEELMSGPEPLAEVIREYVRWVHEDEAWARTLIREALDGGFPISDTRVARLVEIVERTRMRQTRGEISGDLDVGAVSLALLAACVAPVLLPAFARAFVGVHPSSPEFRDRYADLVARLITGPARPEADSGPVSGGGGAR